MTYRELDKSNMVNLSSMYQERGIIDNNPGNNEIIYSKGKDSNYQYPNSNDNRLDINTLKSIDFKKVRGIGSKKAKRIENYIQSSLYPVKIKELKRINGVGDKLINRIQNEFK